MTAQFLKIDREIYHQEQLNEFFSHAELASNSKLAYYHGLKKFNTWLAKDGYVLANDIESVVNQVCCFLADMAKSNELSFNSLSTYAAGIVKELKETLGIDLSRHPDISKLKIGICRKLKPSPSKKQGLRAEDIKKIVPSAESQALPDIRDRALLLLGFAGAFRRSELVGIEIEHLEFCNKGLSIRIPHSKTDQLAQGHHVEIPRKPASEFCPVSATERLIKIFGIKGGALFRGVDRHGNISARALNDKSVALIVKIRGVAAGYDETELAGHSLRRGFVLNALEAGATETAVVNTTRQAPATLRHYASEKKNWRVNALNHIDL